MSSQLVYSLVMPLAVSCDWADVLYAHPLIIYTRGLSGLRLSEFVQISEFFRIYITDICQTSESFAKSVNLK